MHATPNKMKTATKHQNKSFMIELLTTNDDYIITFYFSKVNKNVTYFYVTFNALNELD